MLTINANKTCYTLFKGRKKHIPHDLNSIKLGRSVIKRVKSAKYLGITFDENLEWDEHIDNICNSMTKVGNAFKIRKHHIPEANKAQL